MDIQTTTKRKRKSQVLMALSFVVLGALSVLAVGCGGGGAGSPVASAASDTSLVSAGNTSFTAARWTSADITYDIRLVSSSYDAAANATTFVYNVISNPAGGPAISHWMLLIPDSCASAVSIVSSSDAETVFGRDGSTGYNGLKFDTGYADRESRVVSLVLAGRWGVSDIQILVKSGNGFVIGTAQGPSCSVVAPVEHKISGNVFLDVVVNNVQDASEPGVDGIKVILRDAAGNVVAETFTDASGGYSFTVPEGEYTVSFEIPSGLIASGPVSIPVDIRSGDSAGNSVGVSIDLAFIGTQTANGLSMGFWKTNVSKAISGVTKGVQIGAATLNAYVSRISVFGLLPLNVTSLQQADAIFVKTGSIATDLLAKQLLASEFNYMNGAFIGGDERLTRLFLLRGEVLLADPSLFTREQLLQAQKWYDAYNNSHGSLIVP